jgi:hypothetical protein
MPRLTRYLWRYSDEAILAHVERQCQLAVFAVNKAVREGRMSRDSSCAHAELLEARAVRRRR